VVVIWARDEADGQVKGFLVEKGTPGFVATKMQHKIALRAVQNADITLTDVQVAETARLQNANSFVDTAGRTSTAKMSRGRTGSTRPGVYRCAGD